ncbi:MAG: GTPase ObgE [Candidatus Campbellbacteria bacterium]|nr:GTPase ObgE [Candidatus Campbellbacteria bacterium]
MLVDELTVSVKAGDGGNGIVHWLRAKFVPKGGPDGGDGGDGGNVYFRAVRDIGILSRYSKNQIFKADSGENGQGAKKKGKDGADIIIDVPAGSVLKNMDTSEVFDLDKEGKKVLIASGGKGGLGNDHFKSSRNTTPKTATPGEKGQEYKIFIELRLIAHIGLIGFPNAGKSTLLNLITNANAKIGDYPFTTLEPNLGVYHGFVIADIPGIIEDASDGKGLGIKFLRHISRALTVVHLISTENDDILEKYNSIRKEMGQYSEELLKKPEIILITKTDLVSDDKVKSAVKLLSQTGKEVVPVSAYDDNSLKIAGEAMAKVAEKAI